MICPRCGTPVASDAARCTRCAGSLGRPEAARTDLPAVTAPTKRGELHQRQAGIVPEPTRRPAGTAPAGTAPAAGAAAPAGAAPAPPWIPPPPPPPPPRLPGSPGSAPRAPSPAAGPREGSSGSASPAPPPPGTPPAAGPKSWPPPPAPFEPAAPAPGPGSYPPSPVTAGPSAEQGGRWGGWDAPPRPQGWAERSGWGRPTRWAPRPPRGDDGAGPRSYFWPSIVATVLLFWPTGIAAIYFSVQVTRRMAAGDVPGALRSSRLARTFCMLSVAMFLIVLGLLAEYLPNLGS
ncbi:MAG TPA: CD225/dispanin family protein [Acidimicrobiales bacterium]|nr:CD225/dispanin family protein [Acidimicrobiales bacterium]